MGAEQVEEESSDSGSETGTYTIDKETPEIVTARLSIDANYGIDTSINNKHDSTAWVSEWASTTLNHKNSYNVSNVNNPPTKIVKASNIVSKIPSPMATRATLGSRGKINNNVSSLKSNDLSLQKKEQANEASYDTECYLKATEKMMTAIEARMCLSLDSGGESENDSKCTKKSLQRSDSSASESGSKSQASTVSRYNRAFSLRRGRLDVEKKAEPQPRVSKFEIPPQRSTSSVRSKPTTPALPPQSCLSRTDNVRLSMRAPKHSVQSPILSGPKNDTTSTKKKSLGGGRSNSTLSSKEVEFQNWKRRKNYDPIKAAAAGKKKEVPSKKSPFNSISQSATAAGSAPKSPVASVLRSASFHGTRQLSAGPSSSEDEEDITLSAEDEDWPKAPKTSLENTPRDSQVSLFSNSPNSPRARHKLEGVDNLVVSAISNLSSKLKVNASSLLKKLRYLYDEESDKYKALSIELEQLELHDNSGSPQKSSSRELALTLKNLKRIDTTLKVLNEVLFDNVDYE
ncbi:uncharacterized protein LOC106666749 isoform X2 [Cimex lectularius]|nr:uncharacterized protein LOC106666749 isoform X2 [Cimex lectularius]XP_014249642.1 uncharacterized protein LOC106666749 isoform X2 [Cimex lectularius]